MTKKIRVRLINGERWYSALDLGGEAVKKPNKNALAQSPCNWLSRRVGPEYRKVIKPSFFNSQKMLYIHESKAMEWLVYVSQRERAVDIRKTHSVAQKARLAGVAMVGE